MKKFLLSTLIFTLVSYAVQYAMDFLAPLDNPSPSLSSLSGLGDIDNLLNDPAALEALQGQLSNTDGLVRMVHITIITCLLMAAWSLYRSFKTGAFFRSTLRWGSNKNFLAISKASPEMTRTDDNILMRSKPTMRVLYFIFKGENTGRKPLRDIDGYIQSLHTRLKIPLLLDGMASSARSDIAGQADFLVTARFQSTTGTEGYGIDEFWREFGPFRFVFEYNDKQYHMVFDKQMLEKVINQRVKELKS